MKKTFLRMINFLISLGRSSNILTQWIFKVKVSEHNFPCHYWDISTIGLKVALDKYARDGMKILEIGMGPLAILSVYLSKKKKVDVTAVDIYPPFIMSAKETAIKNNVRITMFQSDLFSKIKGIFDIVFFNPPYVPTGLRKIRGYYGSYLDFMWDGGPNGCRVINRFLKEVHSVLDERSIVLLGVNTLCVGDMKIEQLLKKNRLELVSTVSPVSSVLNPAKVYVIREVRPQNISRC